MKDEPRKDGYDGYKRIKLSQSNLIDKNGVYININDHFEVNKDSVGVDDILQILNSNWEKSLSKSESVANKLWKNLGI